MADGQVLIDICSQGRHEELKGILLNRANPAECDKYGLTPLMYAAWNGHVECVKYIVANPMGVDCYGIKRDCISMISCLGYSALHLCCLDGPSATCCEIAEILLAFGCNERLRCNKKQTAYDIAKQLNRGELATTILDFRKREFSNDINQKYNTLISTIREKYTFQYNARMQVKLWKANYPLPSFLFRDCKEGCLRNGMKIHESQIEPLAKVGFKYKNAQEAMRTLTFAKTQAENVMSLRKKYLEMRDEDIVIHVDDNPTGFIPPKPRRRRLNRDAVRPDEMEER